MSSRNNPPARTLRKEGDAEAAFQRDDVKVVQSRLRLPVHRPRHDGAAELHGALQGRQNGDLVHQPVSSTRDAQLLPACWASPKLTSLSTWCAPVADSAAGRTTTRCAKRRGFRRPSEPPSSCCGPARTTCGMTTIVAAGFST